MAQDHLLFIILKEKTTKIWEDKLDWIAERNGMALLNTHPDYMDFDGTGNNFETYSVKKYIDFLKCVKAKYGERYWHVGPHKVYDFFNKYSENVLESKAYPN
jgi:hypothetical protein